MKKFFKEIITKILSYRANQLLKKNKTQVIAITGSIGKTSTKQAIHHLLSKRFKVYASQQGFNTPLGISLAILQENESGFSSPAAWFKILKRAWLSPKKPYPKIVLEMGADKPGDLAKLVKIAPPQISVITNVNAVHLNEGQFKSIEEILYEKSTLIRVLPETGLAILNFDDKRVKGIETKAEKIGYGQSSDYNLYASELKTSAEQIEFKVTYKDKTTLFKVPVLGEFQLYVLLPAIAVGLKLGMELNECAKALKDLRLPPGRMNPIAGINDSTIIDSSYNASPKSMERALDFLKSLPNRKIAALGTMNELGEITKEAHLNLGKYAAKVANSLIAVGKEAATIKQGALEAGMKESKVFTFFDSEEAGAFLQGHLQAHDVVLVKGSQNRVRMEKAVKMIMKEPQKASELLCRQEEAWNKL